MAAAGLYALAELDSLAGVRELLIALAGGLGGAALIRRPGDLPPVVRDDLPLG